MSLADARTVPELLFARAERSPDREAFRYPVGRRWRSLTWRAFAERVRAAACGLIGLGLQPGERVLILSTTRLEWVIADLATLCAGGVTAAAHVSSGADEWRHLLSDAAAVLVFCESVEQGRQLSPGGGLSVKRIVLADVADAGELTLAELEARGREFDREHPGAFAGRVAQVEPASLAAIVYTSGTSGAARGVDLTHSAFVSQAEAIAEAGILDDERSLQFFWLPLAHSFGRSIIVGQLRLGFASAIEGRRDRLAESFRKVRPHFACVVPRVLERVRERVLARAARSLLSAALLRWALAVGARDRRERDELRGLRRLQFLLADGLVLARVRAVLGGRLRFLVCGAAPLSREVADFFWAAGIPILEGYGLTESCSVTHCNRLWAAKSGSVGRPLPGVQTWVVRDGEVLLRAPWLMSGYHGLPADTAEALDGEGWLRTGDIGTIDADGYLRIVDRKKDLIKTPAGEYVAPQQLEVKLTSSCSLLSQALVTMDERGNLRALVTLSPGAVHAWVGRHHFPQDPSGRAPARALRAEVEREVEAVNATLPGYATIAAVTVLAGEFSEGHGELTPSLKLRRQAILSGQHDELVALGPAPAAASVARRRGRPVASSWRVNASGE